MPPREQGTGSSLTGWEPRLVAALLQWWLRVGPTNYEPVSSPGPRRSPFWKLKLWLREALLYHFAVPGVYEPKPAVKHGTFHAWVASQQNSEPESGKWKNLFCCWAKYPPKHNMSLPPCKKAHTSGTFPRKSITPSSFGEIQEVLPP